MTSVSSFASHLIHAKIKGWKQTVLYLLTITLSSSVAYIYFDDEIYKPYTRHQKQLAVMTKELVKKQQRATDFKSLQQQLDNIQAKSSCVNTLPAHPSSPEDKKQWNDCVSKELVIKRLTQFNHESESFLATFNNPWEVLKTLAVASREAEINNVEYKITSLTNDDNTESVPLILETNIQSEKIFSYMEILDVYCKSCLIKIHSLHYNESTQSFDAAFKLNLYLDAGRESKKWQQAISDGKLSGKDLASYKHSN